MAEPLPAGPSKTLEAIVGWFVPPACREEVLGDLHEKYSGTAQYILLALQVVPCVIVSRIWRATDARVLMMQTLLVYGSYVAAAWYTSQRELAPLAIPPILAVVFMMLEDAWSPTVSKSPLRLTGEVALGTLFAFLCMVRTLPGTLNLFGACASLLLVSAVRILFRPQISRHQVAAGPVAPDEPAALSDLAKGLLAIAGAVLLSMALISVGLKPGMVGSLIFIIALVIGLRLNRSRKE